jgi:hypothetical protein
MRAKKNIVSLIGMVALLVLGFGQACAPLSKTALQQSEQASASSCLPGPGASGAPATIEEAVALINSLPKPVSVPCSLESLSRPLKVVLTNNQFSGQPAVGNRSPRIFILNDKLTISVVPEGSGQDLVEFSFLASNQQSIKAEIQFPVVQSLSARAPYDRILLGAGTSCGICHGPEVGTSLVPFATAFVSKAFRPASSTLVNLTSFRAELHICNPAIEPERCAMLKALFGQGQVQSSSFPSDMPTPF